MPTTRPQSTKKFHGLQVRQSPVQNSKEKEPSEMSEPDPPPPSWLLVKSSDLKRPTSSIKALIRASVAVFIIGGLAVTVYSQRERKTTFLVQTGVIQAVGNVTSLLPPKSENDDSSTVAAAKTSG